MYRMGGAMVTLKIVFLDGIFEEMYKIHMWMDGSYIESWTSIPLLIL